MRTAAILFLTCLPMGWADTNSTGCESSEDSGPPKSCHSFGLDMKARLCEKGKTHTHTKQQPRKAKIPKNREASATFRGFAT